MNGVGEMGNDNMKNCEMTYLLASMERFTVAILIRCWKINSLYTTLV
jgi:hypothetical protein